MTLRLLADDRDEDPQSAREIFDSLRRVVQALRTASRRTEAVSGMSAAQLFILEKLNEQEPASVSELAERTCTHQTSISGVVARLLKAGLVSKTTSPEDARRVELRMTPAGKTALRSSAGSVQAEMLDTLNQMSLSKRGRLARLLKEWVRLAGLADGTAAMFMEDAPAASAPATRRGRKV